MWYRNRYTNRAEQKALLKEPKEQLAFYKSFLFTTIIEFVFYTTLFVGATIWYFIVKYYKEFNGYLILGILLSGCIYSLCYPYEFYRIAKKIIELQKTVNDNQTCTLS
jgi:hypothetical protein